MFQMTKLLCSILCLFIFSFFNGLQACPFCKKDANKLAALSKDYYEYAMQEFPELATIQGYPGYDHLWTDLSEMGIASRENKFKEMLAELNDISTEFLEDDERLNYEVLKSLLVDQNDWSRFKREYMPMNKLDGIHINLGMILSAMSTTTSKDVDNLLSRLKTIPNVIDQTIELLKKGVALGLTTSKVSIKTVPEQITQLITENPMDSYYFVPFTHLSETLSPGDRQLAKDQAQAILLNDVFPALQKLHDYLENEYISHCRDSVSLSDLPDGQEWYLQCIRSFTTTTLSPTIIHQIGLEEVARIQEEMGKIKLELNFIGDNKEFFTFLRTDPSFFYSDRKDLLQGYRDILKKIELKLPDFFGKLPTSPYKVAAIPESSEDQAVAAYYLEGSSKASRPGIFFVNTGKVDIRPKWEMEALALHEALPGHHMQISLALENETLPDFRSICFFTAYVEGWGLYSEGLGRELGLYQDPYSKFGRLNMEMLRALRLVIDTGIHALGWTRQEAIDYCLANSGLSLHDIETEVDRYITWPGQALAYKIGERKILEMRQYAEEKLGDRFDIRAFHDEVLRHGALPLTIFEAKLKQWASQR